MFSGDIVFSEIPGSENIVSRMGDVDDRIKANTAVIVGTAFSATELRYYDMVTTHTLWGEIAYQLGYADGEERALGAYGRKCG